MRAEAAEGKMARPRLLWERCGIKDSRHTKRSQIIREAGPRSGTKRHRASRYKTNAARASHPSRIVFADVLSCRLSPRRKIVSHRTLRMLCVNASPEARASGLWFNVFHPSGGKDFSRRPLSPGTGALDMHRISPGDSLSKITGNAEPLLGTNSEQITLLTASTLRQRRD
jgi:hypothetical protein